MGIINSGVSIKCDVCGKEVVGFPFEARARVFGINNQWIFFYDLLFCSETCQDTFFLRLYKRDQLDRMSDKMWKEKYKKLVKSIEEFCNGYLDYMNYPSSYIAWIEWLDNLKKIIT